MQRAAQDILRRRPVWEAMSELFLDTELEEAADKNVPSRHGPMAHPHATKDVGMVILNVLVKNLALDSKARCFASTLNMTLQRLYFQSGDDRQECPER